MTHTTTESVEQIIASIDHAEWAERRLVLASYEYCKLQRLAKKSRKYSRALTAATKVLAEAGQRAIEAGVPFKVRLAACDEGKALAAAEVAS